jgi:hypothetical protein
LHCGCKEVKLLSASALLLLLLPGLTAALLLRHAVLLASSHAARNSADGCCVPAGAARLQQEPADAVMVVRVSVAAKDASGCGWFATAEDAAAAAAAAAAVTLLMHDVLRVRRSKRLEGLLRGLDCCCCCCRSGCWSPVILGVLLLPLNEQYCSCCTDAGQLACRCSTEADHASRLMIRVCRDG